MRTRKGLFVGALLVGAVLLSSGCLFEKVEGEVRSESETVRADGAEKLEAKIEFGAGKLEIDGKAEELFSADWKFASSIREPRVSYEVRGSTGELLVEDIERTQILGLGGFDSEWKLSFNSDVPTELELLFGAGESRLDLADMDLDSLNLQFGAGSSNINLADTWDHDVEIDIDQGVGELIVHLPTGMPVRIDVDRGLGVVEADDFRRIDGDYVNEAYDEDEDLPTITVNIDQGIGSTILNLVDTEDVRP